MRVCCDAVFPDLVRFCGNFYFKFLGNFNEVCSFLMLFCVGSICNSVWFCDIRTPLTPPFDKRLITL